MVNITEKFKELEPEKKQKIVWIVGSIALFFFLWIFVTGYDENKRKTVKHKVVEEVFTSGDSDKLGVKAMGSQLIELRRAVTQLEQEREKDKVEFKEKYRALNDTSNTKINAIQELLRNQGQMLKEKEREIKKLGDHVNKKDMDNAELIKTLRNLPPTVSTDQEEMANKPKKIKEINNKNTAVIENEWELFSNDDGVVLADGSTETTGPIMSGYKKYEQKEQIKAEDNDVVDSFHIPTGSIFSGVLINGLDAPTNKASKSDPMPVLLRVKHDTILPNRFKMDLKECFMLATGYGTLSSERINLRSEKLSCQKMNGDVVDIRLDAYAVSKTDGKAGIRGRLVSRNGRLLAMSMLAGFGSGLSEATRPQAIPVISDTGSSDTQFQSASTSDAFEAAAYNGASTALENLADYYLDMAEETFPILELDAGTRIDFIVHIGTIAKVTKAINPKG